MRQFVFKTVAMLMVISLLAGFVPAAKYGAFESGYAWAAEENTTNEGQQVTITQQITADGDAGEAALAPPELDAISPYVNTPDYAVTGRAAEGAEVTVAVIFGEEAPMLFSGEASEPSGEPGIATFRIMIAFTGEGSYEIAAYAVKDEERSVDSLAQRVFFDRTAPNPPFNAFAILGSPDQVVLQWEPAMTMDPEGSIVPDPSVNRYRIIRDGQPVGETADLMFIDPNLPETALFHYGIEAIDHAGNISNPYRVIASTFHKNAVKIAGVPENNSQGHMVTMPVMSKNGSTVLFVSDLPDLPGAGAPEAGDVGLYAYEVGTGAIARIGNTDYYRDNVRGMADVSANGRYAAYVDISRNIMLHDRQSGLTVPVTNTENGRIDRVSMSGDGIWLAFSSDADGITPGDRDGLTDIFLYHTGTKTITRLTPVAEGAESIGEYRDPVVSGGGSYVMFTAVSDASPGRMRELFVYSIAADRTDRADIRNESNAPYDVSQFSVSQDGRYVAFLGALQNGPYRIYVHDRQERLTRSLYNGPPLSSTIDMSSPVFSEDGRYVAMSYINRNPAADPSTGPFDSAWGAIRFEWQTGAYAYLGDRGKMTRQPGLSADGNRAVFLLGSQQEIYLACLTDVCSEQQPEDKIDRVILSVPSPVGRQIPLEGSLQITAIGGPGQALRALVAYETAGGMRTGELPLTERMDASGIYSGTWQMPDGAFQITGVRAESAANPSVAREADAGRLPLRVAGELRVLLDTSYLSHLGGSVIAAVSASGKGGASAVIGSDTLYRLALAGSDDYRLTVRDPNGVQLLDMQSIAVVDGQRREITVSPVPSARLEVLLEDDKGRPVAAGAEVRFRKGSSGTELSARADASGSFRLPGELRAGETWTVTAVVPEPYIAPAAKELTLGAGRNTLTLALERVADGSVEGTVAYEDGTAAPGVTVKLIHTLRGTVDAEAETDANGRYSLSAPQGLYRFEAARTKPPLLQVVGLLGNITLTPGTNATRNVTVTALGGARIEINARVKPVDGDWRKIDLWERRTASEYGLKITGSNPAASVYPGMITRNTYHTRGVAGDVMKVCIGGGHTDYSTACSEAVLDDYLQANVHLDMMEKARITGTIAGYLPGDDVRIGVELEEGGKFRNLHTIPVTTGGRLSVSLHETGKIRLRIQKTFPNRNVPPYYPTAVVQYVDVDVAEGQLVELPPIVLRDTTDWFYGVPGNGLTARREAIAGDSVSLRGSYRLSEDRQALKNVKLRIEVPAGTEMLEDSVVLNGSPVGAQRTETNVYELPVGDLMPGAFGSLNYRLKLEASATERFEASLRIAYERADNGERREEWIGTTYVYPVQLTLTAPGQVVHDQVPVSGRAPAGVRVSIYANDELAGEAIATAGGLWFAKVRLPQSPSAKVWGDEAVYRMTAVMKSDDVLIRSNPVSVSYDKDHAVITEVNMTSIYSNVSFDPAEGVARFPFVADMGLPLTFRVKFNNSERVSNVRIQFEDGELRATYIAAEDVFRATTTMKANKLGGIYVTYDTATEELSPVPRPDPADLGKAVSGLPDAWRLAQYELADEAEAAKHLGANPLMDLSSGAYNSPLVKVTMGNSDKYTGYMRVTARRATGPAGGKPYRDVSNGFAQTARGVALTTRATLSESLLTPTEKAAFAALLTGHNKDDVDQLIIGLTTAFPDSLNAKVMDIANNLRSYVTDAMDFSDYADELISFQDYVIQNECHGPTKNHYINMTNLLYESATDGLLAKNTITGYALIATHLNIPPMLGFGIGEGLLGLGNTVKNQWKERLDALKEDFKKDQEWRDRMAAAGAIDRCKTPEEVEEAERFEEENMVADPTWIYDPSGYVYEAVPSNRLEGVQASLYRQDPQSGEWRFWDAEWYLQRNPLMTDTEGRYGWDVPEGKWQVRYEKEGYQTAYSDELIVLPPHFDVNIPMVSYQPPTVQEVVADEARGVYLSFSKPMRTSSVTTVSVLMESERGEPVEGAVEAIRPERTAEGVEVAKHYRFIPSGTLAAGSAYRFTVLPEALSYAEVPMLAAEKRDLTVLPGDAAPKEAGADLQALPGSRSVTLTWRAEQSPLVKAMKLYWREAGKSNDAYTNEAELPPGQRSYALTGLNADTSYEIKLVTVGVNEKESAGLTAKAQTPSEEPLVMDATPAGDVTNAVAARTGAQSLGVRWTDPSDADLRSVMLAWRKKGDSEFGAQVSAAPGVQRMDIAGLAPNTVYEIRISTADTYWNESAGIVLEGSTQASVNQTGGGGGSGTGAGNVSNPPSDEEVLDVGAGELIWSWFEDDILLRIAPGTLPAGSKIAIRKLGAGPETVLPAPLGSYSDLFRIAVDGSNRFSQPVKLSMRYRTAAGSEFDLRKVGVFRRNDRDGSWSYVGGTLNRRAGIVTAEIGEPGIYALLSAGTRFKDLNGHWAQEMVEVLAGRTIVSGRSRDVFAPSARLTRAEATKLLVETMRGKATSPQGSRSFSDVRSEDWFYPYLVTAAAAGWIEGSGDRFRPNDPISREELAALFIRALGWQEEAEARAEQLANTGGTAAFADGKQVAPWAAGYVEVAREKGLMQGSRGGQFLPKANATRAEGAVLLFRAIQGMGWIEE
ncbi:hypothetical protein B1A99_22335 [Cohnella sp. CIP 111063]|uniref:S-layer homology domain-containing protein n=1 Tax=unclassified Cohnella TaxID=2636738 RepID=UPI000B8C3F14|nr:MULTISPECIES: S-layer homology domain-containing protein [unclassified Cohnella]OXS55961.1 hypothetical protein B1A99_22335 [Cohnella sp. CIP 111063]PRX67171.1 WD40 repeat protein [Cohnella sp. SGD-V74]